MNDTATPAKTPWVFHEGELLDAIKGARFETGDYSIPATEVHPDSLVKLAQMGFNHRFNNVAASTVQKKYIEPALIQVHGEDKWKEHVKAKKARDHISAFRESNPQHIEAWTKLVRDTTAHDIRTGNLPDPREAGESEFERVFARLVTESVEAMLKVAKLGKPKKGQTVTIGGEAWTWDRLFASRAAKDEKYGFSKTAREIVAENQAKRAAKAAENAAMSRETEASAEDLDL